MLDLDLLSLGRSNNDGLSTIKDKKLKLVLRRVAAKNIGFVTLFKFNYNKISLQIVQNFYYLLLLGFIKKYFLIHPM